LHVGCACFAPMLRHFVDDALHDDDVEGSKAALPCKCARVDGCHGGGLVVEGWAMLATPSTCLCFDSEIRDSIIFLLCWVLNMVHPSTLGEGFDFPFRKTANDLATDPRA